MPPYSTYKMRTLWRLRVAWVLLVTTTGLLAIWLLFAVAPALAAAVVKSVDAIGNLNKVLAELQLEAAIPWLAKLVLVAPLTLYAYGNRQQVAQYVFSRWLDRFDDEVWHPVRRPAPFLHGDQVLPWLAPEATLAAPGRLSTWQEMRAWVEDGAAMSNGTPARVPFSWALLVGRSGAGKSRHADEFARLLARRDLLGDSAAPQAGWRLRRKRWQLQLTAAIRRARRRPRATDPWDAGRPAHRTAQGSELLSLSTSYKINFEAWRPRAPTLIVFEDPRAEEAAALIAWLSAKTARTDAQNARIPYHFPVRLLIVNQTLPSDLQLIPDAKSRSWRSGLPHFRGDPWVMNERHYFTWKEVLALSHRAFRSDDRRAWVVRDVQSRFAELTHGGHPLLVEALFSWIRSHKEGTLPDVGERLTAEQLLADRAQRVLVALEAAGIETHAQLSHLAAATLVDGLPRASLDSSSHSLNAAALQRVFPDADVQLRVPGVKPDLIGRAFVELVVTMPLEPGIAGPAAASVQSQSAAWIANLAWRSDAYATLRWLDQQLHRQAEEGTGALSGPRRLLVEAVERATQDIRGLDPDVALRAFARYYLVHGRGQAHLRAVMQQVPATVILEELAGAKLLSLTQPHAAAARDLLAVFSLACEQVLGRRPDISEDETPVRNLVVARLVDAYVQLADELEVRGEVPLGDGIVPSVGFAMLGEAAVDMWCSDIPEGAPALAAWPVVLERLSRSRSASDAGLRPFAEGFCERLRERIGPAPGWLGSSYGIALCGLSAEIHALEIWLQAEMQGPLHQAHAVHLVTAWAKAAQAHVVTGKVDAAAHAMRCAQRVDDIANAFKSLPLAEQRVFAERRAEAWSYVAHAHLGAKTPKGALLAARCAKRIAGFAKGSRGLPLADQRGMASWLAQAWCCAANAHTATPTPEGTTQAEQCARRIALICQLFSDIALREQRVLVVHQAWAYCYAAHGHAAAGGADGAAQAERCTRHIASITRPFRTLPLAERLALANALSESWGVVAFTHAKSLTLDGGARAVRCARRIAAISRPFSAWPLAERRMLVVHEAEAISHAGKVYAVIMTPQSAVLAERCADHIAKLAQPYEVLPLAEQRQLAEYQAETWGHAAFAHAFCSPATADNVTKSEYCAQRATKVAGAFCALPLQGQGRLPEFRAWAWFCAVAAYAHDPCHPARPRLAEKFMLAVAPETGVTADRKADWLTRLAAMGLLPR